ncbi:MAG: hypothetical protein HYY01_08495, partial [Chloroflexi bacterium]|nr:hypothetical protein [Chloroflexota bacterium]
MTNITISISDDRMQRLREKASHFKVSPEELVRVSLEDLLTRPEADFVQALEYVCCSSVNMSPKRFSDFVTIKLVGKGTQVVPAATSSAGPPDAGGATPA